MDRIKLKVFGLSYSSMSQSGAYALILTDEYGKFRIPIIIGIAEAQSIAMQLEHLHSERPLTHDLIKSLTDRLDVTLEEVFIYKWEAGIFYSELFFKKDDEIIKIDARTSDAIALALRYGCAIFMANTVLDKTAIPVTETTEDLKKDTDEKEDVESGETKNEGFTKEELTRLMDEAVKNEDYENASRFRDMLKSKEEKDN